jgi:glycosyltransferase involved in cell wall biosynthesis
MKYSNNKVYDSTSQLTICIPAFNEEKVIEAVLNDVINFAPNSEIIVVDDGSVDLTADIVKKFNEVTLLSNFTNLGYGASLKYAMKKSTRDFILWFDSDGQHSAKDIEKVILPLLNDKADCVIGLRPRHKTSYQRKYGKKLIQFAANRVAGEKILDFNSGLRCFRKNIILKYIHLLPNGFSASTTSTLIFIKRGYRLQYEKISINERVGKSTIRFFRDGLRTFSTILNIFILFDSLKFFGIIGTGMLTIGLLYGLYFSFLNSMGFPVLGSTIMLFGFLTILFGIISEQITAIRKEKFE